MKLIIRKHVFQAPDNHVSAMKRNGTYRVFQAFLRNSTRDERDQVNELIRDGRGAEANAMIDKVSGRSQVKRLSGAH